MQYDLLQNTRDKNEILFNKGYLTVAEYFDNEKQLSDINHFFIINLN